MANRRETMGEKTGGRGARSSNKENKQKGTDPEKDDNLPADKSVRRSVSMELHVKRPYYRERSPVSARLLEEEASIPHSPSAQGHPTTPGLDSQALQQEALNYFSLTMPGDNAVFLDSLEKTYGNIDGLFSRSTPPQTPGLSPSKSSGSRLNIPPESPYDPLRTPAFRHSPARLPSDQPWRASGAASSQAVRQLTLGMLVCGEASPTVRGLDVSPIVIVPASERKKRSIFSPPTRTPTAERSLALLASMQDDPDQGGLIPSPRQLFADTASGRTPSILSRMGDFDWASSTFTPLKSAAPLGVNQSPFADIEDPFKAYIQCSPAPKSLGDSSPAQPPSSSGSDSSAPRKGFDAPCTELPASPTPASGSTRSSAFPTMSKLRWRVFPEEDSEVDAMMDVEDAAVLVPNPDMAKLGLGTPVRLAEPIHRRTNSNDTTDDSIDSSSSAAPSSGTSDRVILSSGSSASAHSRRDGSPFRFGSHGRQRSASGSSSSHKSSLSSLGASAGLMDKILGRQDRPQRRRTSHNHDNEVSVDAMGSPFKLGRKTSRSEFLYSLDGDCEMQEAQPKKRRRTISGRD
ncbi:hypothetical protein C8Q78DRAFT_967961 [Trametes maxima]|nr:hypothetical protein C8Q78DRAFT_967961 [Trametes maxima]